MGTHGQESTFALNGKADMPLFPKPIKKSLIDISFSADSNEIKHGGTLYLQYCILCHGGVAAGPGALPDLAYSDHGVHKIFKEIVLKGLLLSNGMPNFGNRLGEKDVTDIHNYILATAKKQKANHSN